MHGVSFVKTLQLSKGVGRKGTKGLGASPRGCPLPLFANSLEDVSRNPQEHRSGPGDITSPRPVGQDCPRFRDLFFLYAPCTSTAATPFFATPISWAAAALRSISRSAM